MYGGAEWDWYEYEVIDTEGKTFTSGTIFTEISEALDDAIDRAVMLDRTIEQILIIPEDDYVM